jgi:hypothetical protein
MSTLAHAGVCILSWPAFFADIYDMYTIIKFTSYMVLQGLGSQLSI